MFGHTEHASLTSVAVYGCEVSALWVARLHVSKATRAKIFAKHMLDADEVRQHIECTERLFYVWDEDPERGRRAIVRLNVRGQSILAVLYPAQDQPEDEYHLGSAYPSRS